MLRGQIDRKIMLVLPKIHLIVGHWRLLEACSVGDDATWLLVYVEVRCDVQFVGRAPVQHGRPVVLLSLVGQAIPIKRAEALRLVALEVGGVLHQSAPRSRRLLGSRQLGLLRGVLLGLLNQRVGKASHDAWEVLVRLVAIYRLIDWDRLETSDLVLGELLALIQLARVDGLRVRTPVYTLYWGLFFRD